MKTGIVWLRNDLRLTDNVALSEAIKKCGQVVMVYVFDGRQYRAMEMGLKKTGSFRAQFLIESVSDLREGAKELGADLVVRLGNPATELARIAQAIEATDIFWQKEYTHEEQKTEEEVAAALAQANQHTFDTLTLYHPEDLPITVAQLPDVFTQFRKKAEKYADVRDELPAPESLPALPAGLEVGDIPSLSALHLSTPDRDQRAAIQFVGGETEALKRLDDYIWKRQSITTYKETRNGLIGEDYSTKFSPWLACGCLSPRTIYHEIKAFEAEVTSNQSTYWVIFELIWRDYFKYVAMRYGRRIFYPEGIKGVRQRYLSREQDFTNWMEGTTGQPFIDANMNELRFTGFMSNRGRQNVASYLCKDLSVDWRWGAAWFEQCLIDYDPASNWGNWIYVAGVGNDPREDRYFNVPKQARQYDPEGKYQLLWA